MDTTIAILAGGESRRMGQDKASLIWQGRTFLEHAVQTSLQAASRVVVAGRLRPPDWPYPAVPFLPDAAPNEGPLRGLEAALIFSGGSPVLVTGCDMPFLTESGLRWLLAHEIPAPCGLVTLCDGQPEPLFSLYTASCLPLVQEHLVQARRSVHSLITVGRFAFVAAPPEVVAQMTNINTPEQLSALHRSRSTP